MDERQQLVAEYFKLYVLLNRTNRHRNEQTELEFEFEKLDGRSIFLAQLKGSSENAKIQLCFYDFISWEATGYSGLHFLEEQISLILNNACETLKIKPNRKLNAEQMLYLKTRVQTELRSLSF